MSTAPPLINTFGMLTVALTLSGVLPDVPHQLKLLLASVAFAVTGFTLRHRLWPHVLMGTGFLSLSLLPYPPLLRALFVGVACGCAAVVLVRVLERRRA